MKFMKNIKKIIGNLIVVENSKPLVSDYKKGD